ncbi:MAG: hypothetical protein OXD31_03570 [Chloroflexi bacterium]|nr:hypothetical protein [Chloroflexota bacterium]
MTVTIYLVSCVSQKQPNPAAAKDLYISPWFKKARRFVDATGLPWFVLSAKYGLSHPDRLVDPYELTLNNMPVKNRRLWADRVLVQLRPHLDGVDIVVFMAGLRYREFLAPALRHYGLKVSVPMEGLRMGQQLQWLTGERYGVS